MSTDLEDAERALAAGELRAAREAFTAWVAAHPDDPRGHAGLARALSGLRRLAAATEHFRDAARLAPDDPRIAHDLAASLSGQARFAEALEAWRALDALAERAPVLRERPDWMLYWAAAASKAERRPEALAVLRRLVALRPGEPRFRARLGHELLQSGDFPAAATELARVARAEPAVARHHYLLGWALLQGGRTAEAEAALRRALELAPEDPEALLELGKLLARDGRDAEAETVYGAAVAANPLAHEGWHALARLARARGADAEAERCTARFEEIRAALDERVEVLRACNRRVATDPRDLEAYRQAARVYLAEGKLEEAEEWLLRLLAVAPADEFAVLNVSTLCALRGELDAALFEAEKLLERDPRHGEANLQAARLHAARRRWSDVVRHLEVALAGLAEQRAEAHALMATALDALGRAAEATRHRAAAQSLTSDR